MVISAGAGLLVKVVDWSQEEVGLDAEEVVSKRSGPEQAEHCEDVELREVFRQQNNRMLGNDSRGCITN